MDEVGRGPLAGPVGVGVVLVSADFDWDLLKGVGDSKRVKPENREAIFRLTKALKKKHQLDYAVVMVKAAVIDDIGIVPAISQATAKALKKVTAALSAIDFEKMIVRLDGGLKAPTIYKNQETIIKGDDKELIIGLASIVAKVTRDEYMKKISSKAEFLPYDFGKHKGYGTKKHRQAIAKHGLSSEHRQSFCRNISFDHIQLQSPPK